MKWASELSDKPGLDDAIADCVCQHQPPDGWGCRRPGGDFRVRPPRKTVMKTYRRWSGSSWVLPIYWAAPVAVSSGTGRKWSSSRLFPSPRRVFPAWPSREYTFKATPCRTWMRGPNSWEDIMQVARSDDPQFVILADPFSFPVQNLILGLDFAFEQSAKIGGLASGARQQGQNALFLNDQVFRNGAVGIALHGNIVVDTVVGPGMPSHRAADADHGEPAQPAAGAGRKAPAGRSA